MIEGMLSEDAQVDASDGLERVSAPRSQRRRARGRSSTNHPTKTVSSAPELACMHAEPTPARKIGLAQRSACLLDGMQASGAVELIHFRALW